MLYFAVNKNCKTKKKDNIKIQLVRKSKIKSINNSKSTNFQIFKTKISFVKLTRIKS